jgi:PRC-barrel domain
MVAHPAKTARLACVFAIFLGLPKAVSEEARSHGAPEHAETPSPTTGAPFPPAKGGAAALVVEGPELEGILGRDAVSRKGEKMGQIVDVLVDHDGEARAAIIDFGGFLGVGSRKIAVDWQAVHFVQGNKSFRIVLDLTREEVTGSREYKPGETVTILQPAPAAASPPQ